MRAIQNDERATLNVLDREECLILLRWESIGRLGVSRPGQAPLVVPINFELVDGDRVHFRCDLGDMALHALEHPVSFEVDRFDPYRRVGWSVLVQGTAQLLTVDEETALDARPDPWAPGERPLLARIVPESITGRKVELRDHDVDGRGYR